MSWTILSGAITAVCSPNSNTSKRGSYDITRYALASFSPLYSLTRSLFQFHISAEASGAMAIAGVAFAEFDGVADFWVDKVEDLLELFHDAEYQEVCTSHSLDEQHQTLRPIAHRKLSLMNCVSWTETPCKRSLERMSSISRESECRCRLCSRASVS